MPMTAEGGKIRAGRWLISDKNMNAYCNHPDRAKQRQNALTV